MANLPPVADGSRSGRGTRLLDDRLGANWAPNQVLPRSRDKGAIALA